ncbi:MAG TPA: MG2 domain-containing protein [Candidatus Saccharicenans sp.]|nr:MG2 domain-containing protein [Candidatus Saccharicenans sp.]
MKKLLSWTLMIVLAAGFFACKKEQPRPQVSMDKEWYKYISAHTSGTIPRKARLRVVFVQPIGRPGETPPPVLEISPAVEGKLQWAGNRVLVFVPATELKPDTEYRAILHVDKIMKLPKQFSEFSFTFRTIKPLMEIMIDGLYTDEPSQPEVQTLKGRLQTSDMEEASRVEKVLQAEQSGTKLPITWSHSGDGIEHDFKVNGIIRGESPSVVRLAWDGSPLRIKEKGEREIEVPPLSRFELLSVTAVREESPHILLRFSDPLDPNQDLTGLLQIGELPLTWEIVQNTIRVYSPKGLRETVVLKVYPGIKSLQRRTLDQEKSFELDFGFPPPQVRFVGRGIILPRKDRLTVPIEAINLKSIQVTAFQIFPDNIAQFLQVNELTGSRELARVGRYLWRKTINLSDDPEVTSNWARYDLDVTPLFLEENGSIYRLILSFNRGNTTYPCPEATSPPALEPPLRNETGESPGDYYWDESYRYPYLQNGWSNRNDPCHDAYYNPNYNRNAVVARNLLCSNLGLVAKMEKDNNLHLVVTDLRTAQPQAGVRLEVYNYQQQLLANSASDSNGFATFQLKERPFLVIARAGRDLGYLRLSEGSALNLSHFDIGGETVKKGIKGFIYGERGVWRPGDTIYLTFVLFDREKRLPANYPVTMELYSPQGQLVRTLKPSRSLGSFHAFQVETEEKAQTGSWQAKVLVGGLTFSRTVRIETVVPNRLKIELKMPVNILTRKDLPVQATINSQWLHGAPAANLKYDITVSLSPKPVVFNKFQGFSFDDPSKEFASGEVLQYKGTLDNQGKDLARLDFEIDSTTPGGLEARFVTRVFEESGDFSLDSFSQLLHPYDYYVGLRLPEARRGYGYLETDKEQLVSLATVDAFGQPVSHQKLKISLYKIDWRWWWEKEGTSLADYLSRSYARPITSDTLITDEKGQASWKFQIKYPDWGRFFIRVEDLQGGHSAGQVVYVDWPDWIGRSRATGSEEASRLTLSADKEKYLVGEKAVIYLPEAVQGRALVSVESASSVLQKMWVSTQKGENRFEVQLTEKMTPNVYVHVSLIQPHSGKVSDAPIRMYGVIPLMVENSETKLEPVLSLPEEIKPLEKFKIKVGEKSSRRMFYTLMVVDEGLLSLTHYQVPDLRAEFYKREALGVSTWDVFDQVAEAYGAELNRILALGGDEYKKAAEEARKPRRFPPVVIFAGPFELKPGETASHEFLMPQYFGAVRVMAVAGQEGAFGSAEKSVPVRRDLMALPTLPRTVRSGEQISLPVTVFVTNPSLKEVEVSLQANEFFEIIGSKNKTLAFSQPGDQIVNFELKTAESIGHGQVSFQVKGGSETISDQVFIEVLSSNPLLTRAASFEVKPGQDLKEKVVPFGLKGTNQVTVEVSSLPALQLEKRLDFLIGYPHGCLEQTLSIAFPQLYLKNLVRLTSKETKDIEDYVRAAVTKMSYFQLPNGAFSYWPGDQTAHDWTSVYAGWFLLEAKRAGYYVPEAMLNSWKENQKMLANSWTTGTLLNQLTQAFRLFTLAEARETDLGAMNRLRERTDLSQLSGVLLAAAFHLSGQPEAAAELVKKVKLEFGKYRDSAVTFGSELRDKALAAHCLSLMDMKEKAKPLIKEIAEVTSSDLWLSTNETATVLLALSSFYGTGGSEPYTFTLAWDDRNPEKVESSVLLEKRTYENFPVEGRNLSLTNSSKNPLYVTIYTKGIPAAGQEETFARGLEIKVIYRDLKMSPLEISSITQGSDLLVDVQIRNNTVRQLQNLVLTHLVASGFQIQNPLFSSDNRPVKHYDYQDVRDDRIYTYFNLDPGELKTFLVTLNASFLGQFYQPGIMVEAMYDDSVQANTTGQWVKIVR